MSGISRELWLSALAEVAPVPEVHPDAISINEFAALVGVRRSAAKDRMRLLVKAGKARKVAKHAHDITGRPCIIPAYVLIQETPDAKPIARLQHSRRRAGR